MKKKFSGSAPSEQQLPQFRLNFDPVFHGQDRQVIGYEARITGIEGEPLESIVTALNPLFLSSLFVKIGYEAMQSAAALGICGLQANLFIPLHARLKPDNLNLAFLKKLRLRWVSILRGCCWASSPRRHRPPASGSLHRSLRSIQILLPPER
jgi:hypothetical protein